VFLKTQGHYDLLLPRPGEDGGTAAARCRSVIGVSRAASDAGSMRGGGDQRAWKHWGFTIFTNCWPLWSKHS
jgi:hypothetical protein